MDFGFITDDALRAKVTEVVTEAIEEATEGLKTKNTELLGKLKKLKQSADIDPDEHQQLVTDNERLTGELSAAQKTVKRLEGEMEKGIKALESESSYVSRLLVDNGLNEALTRANVKPEMQKAVKAMLTGMVTLKTEGDNRVAVIGEQSLGDYVSVWAQSSEGRHFVSAPNNQGGGANGGASSGGEIRQMTRAAFDTQDPLKKADFIKSGGVVIN